MPEVAVIDYGLGNLLSVRRGLDAIVHKVAAQGSVLLGICLGIQMLLDGSRRIWKN